MKSSFVLYSSTAALLSQPLVYLPQQVAALAPHPEASKRKPDKKAHGKLKGGHPIELQDRIKGAYYGALVADAFALHSHYEYDAKVIKEAHGGALIDKFYGPGELMGGTTHGVGWGRRNYHPGQRAGDQTDYGLYNVVALEYLQQNHHAEKIKNPKYNASDELIHPKHNTTHIFKHLNQPIDPTSLVILWKKKIEDINWGAWKCTQSRTTLEQVKRGQRFPDIGGNSNAMAVRSAGIFGAYDDEDIAAQASRVLSFTHRSHEALVGAEFFTRVAHKVIFLSMTPKSAIKATCAWFEHKRDKFVMEQCEKGMNKFKEVRRRHSRLAKEEFADDLAMTSMARLWEVGKTEPIKVGKASPTEGTMPASIYMILKYEDDYEDAVKNNAMVGGDSASRAIAIGMVLGAYHGESSFEPEWLEELNMFKRSESWLQRLPLLSETPEPMPLNNEHYEIRGPTDIKRQEL
ncbi:unnamed protein product [Amoebophrya sp. A120]|nr:unnamed protein product [Amoebophrya sp. A120]|eukprot:GSA120T00016176001.1